MLLNVGSGCGIYVAAAGGVVTAAAEALKGEAKEEGREADNDMVCSLFIIFITNGWHYFFPFSGFWPLWVVLFLHCIYVL